MRNRNDIKILQTVKATNGLCGDLEVRSEMVYAKFNETADFSAGLANRQVFKVYFY